MMNSKEDLCSDVDGFQPAGFFITILDPDDTYKKYLALFSEINSLNLREKLHQWIHGKKFWEQHVSQTLISFFGQENYAKEIWKRREIPRDWEEIWAKIESFQPALNSLKK